MKFDNGDRFQPHMSVNFHQDPMMIFWVVASQFFSIDYGNFGLIAQRHIHRSCRLVSGTHNVAMDIRGLCKHFGLSLDFTDSPWISMDDLDVGEENKALEWRSTSHSTCFIDRWECRGTFGNVRS